MLAVETIKIGVNITLLAFMLHQLLDDVLISISKQ
jgi:hypothetical protein